MEILIEKKVIEAQKHLQDANKSLKTTFFKRKPDLDSAANSYSLAGSCFKVAKESDKAIDCFMKSANCYFESNSLFNSAKQYEQVGFLANEIKNYTLVFESFQRATELLITNGTRDSACILIERGASMLKLVEPEKSIVLYKRALQLSEIDDKLYEMLNFYENIVSISIRIKNYNNAIEHINEIFSVLDKIGTQEQIIKYLLTIILIYLKKDDLVSAINYLNKMKSKYSSSSNPNLSWQAHEIIQAYDEKDDKKFKDLIKNYLTYSIDNEALKLANEIIKSEDWEKYQNVKMKNENLTQSGISNSSIIKTINSHLDSDENEKLIDKEENVLDQKNHKIHIDKNYYDDDLYEDGLL